MKSLREFQRSTKHANNVLPECMLCEAAHRSLAGAPPLSSDTDSEQLEHALAGGVASADRKRTAPEAAGPAASAAQTEPVQAAASGANSAVGSGSAAKAARCAAMWCHDSAGMQAQALFF